MCSSNMITIEIQRAFCALMENHLFHISIGTAALTEPRTITRASYPISYLLEKLAAFLWGEGGRIMHEPLIALLSTKQDVLTLWMVIGWGGAEAGPRSPLKHLSSCRFFICAPAAPALLELPHWLFYICRWKQLLQMSKHFASHQQDKLCECIIACCVLTQHVTRLYFPSVKQLGKALRRCMAFSVYRECLKGCLVTAAGNGQRTFYRGFFYRSFDVASSAGICLGHIKVGRTKRTQSCLCVTRSVEFK